jgi:hypothetical protein
VREQLATAHILEDHVEVDRILHPRLQSAMATHHKHA